MNGAVVEAFLVEALADIAGRAAVVAKPKRKTSLEPHYASSTSASLNIDPPTILWRDGIVLLKDELTRRLHGASRRRGFASAHRGTRSRERRSQVFHQPFSGFGVSGD